MRGFALTLLAEQLSDDSRTRKAVLRGASREEICNESADDGEIALRARHPEYNILAQINLRAYRPKNHVTHVLEVGGLAEGSDVLRKFDASLDREALPTRVDVEPNLFGFDASDSQADRIDEIAKETLGGVYKRFKAETFRRLIGADHGVGGQPCGSSGPSTEGDQ